MKAIMAISENGVIGNKGELPWYIPEDMARFVELTKDHDLLMGRKTFETLPISFFENHKDSKFIILTSDPDDVLELIIETNLDDYCHFKFVTPTQLGHFIYEIEDVENIMVIGGAEIYKQLLPYINTFYLTEIYKEVDGDTTFDTTYLKQEFTEYVIDTIFSYKENCHVTFYEYTRGGEWFDLDEEFMRVAPVEAKPIGDAVNHPSHYADRPVEVIDIIKATLTLEQYQGFLLGNVQKYNFRSGLKDDRDQDLAKGKWYYDKYLETIDK